MRKLVFVAGVSAFLSLHAAGQQQTVTAQVAISYVDLAGARNNLKAEAEGKSFDQIHEAAKAA